jgi:hypothetical protein
MTNWPDYDAALVPRGSLTLWVTEAALAAGHAPVSHNRGGQPVYADVAIETELALRLVFHQPLRQIEGAMRSIVAGLASTSRSRTTRRYVDGPGVARRFFLFRSSTKPLAEESLKSGPVSV